MVASPFERTPLPSMSLLVTILGYPLPHSPGDVLFERPLNELTWLTESSVYWFCEFISFTNQSMGIHLNSFQQNIYLNTNRLVSWENIIISVKKIEVDA